MQQLQPQLPSGPSLVPPPNQRRIRFLEIRPVPNPQFLSHHKSLRRNHHAPLGTDIHRKARHPVCRPSFLPFEPHRDTRIQARPCPHILQHLQRIVHIRPHAHTGLPAPPAPLPNLRPSPSTVNGTPLSLLPISHQSSLIPKPRSLATVPGSRPAAVICYLF